MACDPCNILLNLHNKNKLGPLYIIRPPILGDNLEKNDPNQWIHSFFHKLISNNKNCSPEQAVELETLGVSDLYHIKKNKDHKEYKVEEESVLEFIKAHSYPPLEFPYKIIAVHEADKLSEKISNKWLKTLEEPLSHVTTLFLTSSNRPLLKTIESRAITLRLSPDESVTIEAPESQENFPQYLQRLLQGEGKLAQTVSETQKKHLLKYTKSPEKIHHFLDSLKGSRPLQSELYKVFQSYVEVKAPGPRLMGQWLEETQWFEEAATYNNAPQERFVGLLQLVQSIEC